MIHPSRSDRRSGWRAASRTLALVLILQSAAAAQVSPEEHARHHPDQASGQSMPSPPAGPTQGMMGGMGGMMGGMGGYGGMMGG